MTQPLPGKARCSAGPGANAITSRAKYTHRFVLPMATLIGQIECYKFQQQTNDLPRTLITADRLWNVLWGEHTLGLSSASGPRSVTLGQCDLVRARHISGGWGQEKSRRWLRPKKSPTASCWRLTLKAAPQQQTLKQAQLRGRHCTCDTSLSF